MPETVHSSNNVQGPNDAHGNGASPRNQPVFNVPTIILVYIAVLVVIHLYRSYLLVGFEADFFLISYAFIPARLDDAFNQQFGAYLPFGEIGRVLTFISYSFLHADWLHLGVNSLWLLIFGSVLARRFGIVRFILLSLAGSVAGAFLHLWTNIGSLVPTVGASAVVSAHMAAVSRFAFVPYGPLGRLRSQHRGAYFLPALSLLGLMKNSHATSFLTIWFILNLAIGLSGGLFGDNVVIAWQAHIGGFLVGFLLFTLFDPVVRG